MALTGPLGAGKTHFIKGLAYGVGVRNPRYLSSPSFTLINEYPGRIPFHHIDLYRLANEGEAETLGLDEYLRSSGITVIEWADKVLSLLPEETLWIRIDSAGERERTILVTCAKDEAHPWLEELYRTSEAFRGGKMEEGTGPERSKANPEGPS